MGNGAARADAQVLSVISEDHASCAPRRSITCRAPAIAPKPIRYPTTLVEIVRFPYSSDMRHLIDMGFTDDENVMMDVLIEHGGNLKATIDALTPATHHGDVEIRISDADHNRFARSVCLQLKYPVTYGD